MDLEFTINNQTLKRTDNTKPVNWSDNYLTLVFQFETDDWTGLNKYCLLRVSGELYRVELDNDQVTLPVGVLTSDRLIITLYGSDNEDYRITTNMVSIILGKSGYNIEDIGDIPDIEDMYERVNVGTLVYIFSGNEDDPILKTYWPSSSAPAYSETDSGGNSGDSDATNNGDGSSSGD